MPADPHEFDSRLRQVASPARLTERLRAIPAWPAEQLDAELQAVDLPQGLVDRLHGIPADELLDDALRQVPLSPVSLARVRAVADARSTPAWLRSEPMRWAIAASLIFLVWGGYLGLIGAFASASRPTPLPMRVVWIDDSSVNLSLRQAEVAVVVASTQVPAVEEVWSPEPTIPQPTAPETPLEFMVGTTQRNPVSEVATLMAIHGDLLPRGSFPVQWQTLRAGWEPPVERALWELATVAPSSSPSELWQSASGQPHLFMLDATPVFAPGRDSRLETSHPRLSHRTATFDWARAQVAAGKFPRGESLQVADFLAAMDYNSRGAGAERVAWEVNAATSAGGVMHRGVPPLVLQVGLQAGTVKRQSELPCALQLVIDCSPSMAAGRLEAVELALARLHANLEAADELSLLALGASPAGPSPWLGEQAGSQWLEILDTLKSQEAADLGSGLHAGLEHFVENSRAANQVRRVMVLVTDVADPLPSPQLKALLRLAKQLSAQQIQLQVIHLGPAGKARQDLEVLAQQTDGQCVVAGESFEIQRSLTGMLAGREPLVAEEVSVNVRFNPQQVAAYRLLGDRAPSIVATQQSPTNQLAAGESAVALYEIWLRPEATGPALTVESNWVSRAGRRSESRRQSLSVADLVAATNESPESLWLASLAVATVEALSTTVSPAESKKRIEEVLQVAVNVPPRLAGRADVQRMEQLLREALHVVEGHGRP